MQSSKLRNSIVGLLLYSSGCTTHQGFVNYDRIGVYSSGSAGNLKFKDVGPINATAYSWPWANCDSVATDSVRQLLDIAKSNGANTVYDIKFEGPKMTVTTPTCEKRWGYLALLGIGVLNPWVTVSQVSGIAAKIEREQVIFLPKNSIVLKSGSLHLQLADKFVRDLVFQSETKTPENGDCL